MSKRRIIQSLKNYQKAPKAKQGAFLRAFEKKMIYRTTKTENPQTTRKMVERVLNEHR